MIRKAKIEDVKSIHRLLDEHGEGAVIPRSLSELYEHLRDFYVYVDNGEVVGVSALNIVWADLAEVRSLVVKKSHKGKGLGRLLVNECLNEAKSLGIKSVFVLTFVPEFFGKFGFKNVEKSALPHKIWSDCIKCVKFPDCNEIAMLCKFEG